MPPFSVGLSLYHDIRDTLSDGAATATDLRVEIIQPHQSQSNEMANLFNHFSDASGSLKDEPRIKNRLLR